MPLFSIIVPVYNVEQYLGACVDSLLSQSFRDFEIILVNDGSTDSSGAICRQLCSEHDDVIRLVEQENRGLLLARRAGYSIASGDIIMTVDSDDKLRSDALERIHDVFHRHQVDIVCFEGGRTERYEVNGSPMFAGERVFSAMNKIEVLGKLCDSYRFNSIWSKAFSRRVFDADNGYEQYAGLSFGEDLLQIVGLFDKADTFAYIPDVLYFYRPNPGSLVQKFNPKNFEDLKVSRGSLVSYAKRWDTEYPGHNLLTHVYMVNLWITGLLLQLAAGSMSHAEFTGFCKHVRESEFFRQSYECKAAVRMLRPDIRIVITSLGVGFFAPICGMASVKNLVLGRVRS
ncbi:glycosyltransferase family 2 protein [Bifidobacterium saguinibicoloris]|uniref:glycosyltransferase family 2 protein n=1 Tax=Bifidobacterium saguinibicoloris TaxID=2834433 RepID=UPI001C55B2DC|nr:glycosyltransferase family A protein [Bifidobacterium saguinibicoloris]MBW3081186.1 glycosyltransferase family 2 protein [Bifidobacterium saguinibicoloris]